MGAITSKIPIPAQKPAVVAGATLAAFVTTTIGAFAPVLSVCAAPGHCLTATWWTKSEYGPTLFGRWMLLFAFFAALSAAILASSTAWFPGKLNLPEKTPPAWVYAVANLALNWIVVFNMLFSTYVDHMSGTSQVFIWFTATIFAPLAALLLKKQDEEGADGGADAAAKAGDFSDAATAGAV